MANKALLVAQNLQQQQHQVTDTTQDLSTKGDPSGPEGLDAGKKAGAATEQPDQLLSTVGPGISMTKSPLVSKFQQGAQKAFAASTMANLASGGGGGRKVS